MTDEYDEQDAMFAGLTTKEAAFVVAFGDIESEAFGNATAAALAAGYAGGSVGARSAGWKVLQRPHVRKALATYAAAAQQGLDHVMNQVARIGQLAEAKGDLAVALRSAELLAKRLGGFVERLMISADTISMQRELSEAEQDEARRLADIRLGVNPADAAEAAAAARALMTGRKGA